MQAPFPTSETSLEHRRKAALTRVARAGASPALTAGACASLHSAFSLADLMRRVTESVDA